MKFGLRTAQQPAERALELPPDPPMAAEDPDPPLVPEPLMPADAPDPALPLPVPPPDMPAALPVVRAESPLTVPVERGSAQPELEVPALIPLLVPPLVEPLLCARARDAEPATIAAAKLRVKRAFISFSCAAHAGPNGV
jgi:hypothetical protein